MRELEYIPDEVLDKKIDIEARDRGCEFSRTCLSCRLPQCREDLRPWEVRQLAQALGVRLQATWRYPTRFGHIESESAYSESLRLVQPFLDGAQIL